MKPWDIVLVYWHDSSGVGRWTDMQTVLEDDHIAECWTSGFFLGYSDKCLKVASSASSNDSVDHIMYIPKECVIKVDIIGKGRK